MAGLEHYRAKRDFRKTAEPAGKVARGKAKGAPAASSSSTSMPRPGCTTICGWSMTACCGAGR